MALGVLFRVSLWGESHGCCVGALVEGVPPGIRVEEGMFERDMARRRPGRRLTTPRREPDRVEVLSGVYMGYTTGAPVMLLIRNRDVDSSFYEEEVRFRPRPGHADLPARLRAMGFEDYRGGGPFSGRLTAGLVAAGVLAKAVLGEYGVAVYGYLSRLGGVECRVEPPGSWRELRALEDARDRAPVPCPDEDAASRMEEELVSTLRRGGASLGGAAEVLILWAPPGMGEVLGDSFDADLAKALFT
ncbi:MAG: chorismate synthase, partial [Desulfurococcales archaeon]|nr:chorismate synthase [Desulfurococcales archaeon]